MLQRFCLGATKGSYCYSDCSSELAGKIKIIKQAVHPSGAWRVRNAGRKNALSRRLFTNQVRKLLMTITGLLERMANLVGVKYNDSDDGFKETVNEIMGSIWKYSQTYSIGNQLCNY